MRDGDGGLPLGVSRAGLSTGPHRGAGALRVAYRRARGRADAAGHMWEKGCKRPRELRPSAGTCRRGGTGQRAHLLCKLHGTQRPACGHGGGRVLTTLQRTGRHTQGLASPRAKFPGIQCTVRQGAFQTPAERVPPHPLTPLPRQPAGAGTWPRGALRAAASTPSAAASAFLVK